MTRIASLLVVSVVLCAPACGESTENCQPATANCECINDACGPGLTCVAGMCVDQSATSGSAADGGTSDAGSDSSAVDGDGSGDGGDCSDPSPTIEPQPAASECLPGVPCESDANCPAGHVCNESMSPPACELLYCGDVGTPCDDESVCMPGMMCHAGLCNPCNFCGGLCEVDFLTDPKNCGCCDNRAPAGGVCEDGVPGCPPEKTLCDDACQDLMTSPGACGACGNALPFDQECVDGQPVCKMTGYMPCPNGCVRFDTDENNCGACGNVCPANTYCSLGTCQ